MRRRILIAPDKFKGTLTAAAAAQAISDGWRRVRPRDELILLPMADGGDGTASVFAKALPEASWVAVQTANAVGLPRCGHYLRAGDTAIVELARICGLGNLRARQPMDAHTIGLGIVLATALRSGVRKLIIAPGGSASTDGGTGALSALGATFIGWGGVLPVGGRGLPNLASADMSRMLSLPEGGVDVLVDVNAPLCGPFGAAQTFAPQKGASSDEVAELEQGLSRLADVLGGDPRAAGAGAGGGTAFGMASWGARLAPGAAMVASLIGLEKAISAADVVITGEGRFDETSLSGKAAGYVLDSADSTRRFVLAGTVADAQRGDQVLSLAQLAGSEYAARAAPANWLAAAAAQVAYRIGQ
jgi:glycerate kinase